MNTGQKNRNREQEVAQATRKAKLLAKELNVPVVLLCQLNRESEGRPVVGRNCSIYAKAAPLSKTRM